MNLKHIIKNKHILVIGDSILDHYIYGDVFRVSPEAPVPVILKSRDEYALGGAANVAQNITALCAKCSLISVIGNDNSAEIIRELSDRNNITTYFITDNRPTTKKSRILGNNHQIARIDDESTKPIHNNIAMMIIEELTAIIDAIDGIIIQDYGKGVISKELVFSISEIAKSKNVTILTDPKNRDLSIYNGSSIIKPNLSEFKSALDIPHETVLSMSDIEIYSHSLLEILECDGILVTLSERGMLYTTKDGSFHEEGINVAITDVSGAGDTVSAVFILSIISGASIQESLALANLAGSIVCQLPMSVPIRSELLFDY